MHLIETTSNRDRMTTKVFGPAFTELEIHNAAEMEVWGSSITDDGPDFCLFILKDASGLEIGRKRVSGY